MTDTRVEELLPVNRSGGDGINNTNTRPDELTVVRQNVDTFFLISMSLMTMSLQLGFTFLEIGAVRSKNVTSILTRNLGNTFLSAVTFWLIGYPLAFSTGNPYVGFAYWANVGLPYQSYAQWCFHFVLVLAVASIFMNSLAERGTLVTGYIFSVVLSGLLYPAIVHWTWNKVGWLAQHGYKDYSGSGVLHLMGGVAALVAAVLLGPRRGRFQGNKQQMKGHSVPLTGLGGLFLVLGFLTASAGARGSISGAGDADVIARVLVNMIISGSFAGLPLLLTSKVWSWPVLMILNGVLAGMVSVSAGGDSMQPWGAAATGAVAGLLFIGSHYLVLILKVDDPLDRVATHMVGGLWGLLARPLFMDRGLVYGSEEAVQLLIWNMFGALTIIVWTASLTAITLGVLKCCDALRVITDIEIRGMDILLHKEPAYPADAWIEEQFYYRLHGYKRINYTNLYPSGSGAPPPPPPYYTETGLTQCSFYPNTTQGVYFEQRMNYGPPCTRTTGPSRAHPFSYHR